MGGGGSATAAGADGGAGPCPASRQWCFSELLLLQRGGELLHSAAVMGDGERAGTAVILRCPLSGAARQLVF